MRSLVSHALLAVLLLGGCGQFTEKSTAFVVEKSVEAGKGVSAGVVGGIEQGRKNTRSVDGSAVLSTPAEVHGAVGFTLQESKVEGQQTEVVIAVQNNTSRAIHLVGLENDGGAQLVDPDGFSWPIAGTTRGQLGEAIEVPPNAKVKVNLRFDTEGHPAASVRLWGLDVPLATPAVP